tara:strand:- start:1644 stop:2585 length:942 start_codon:yes stop_codon:yes gene_type:complete
MTKYIYNMETFREVERNYDNTKPIRGKGKNAGKVPIGCRTRPHEEIVKVNDNCYALYDETFWWWKEHREKWAEHGQAAVLWTRDPKKNTESVRIRNCGVGTNAFCRTEFLYHFQPRSLIIAPAGSGHYAIRTGGEEYYLPKNVMCLDGNRAYINQDHYAEYDGMDVTFTRSIGDHAWTLTSKRHFKPRPRVNKELKEQYKQGIGQTRDWMWSLAMVLQNTLTWKTCSDAKYALEARSANDIRGIIGDPDHPMRSTLATHILGNVYFNLAGGYVNGWGNDNVIQIVDNPARFKASFNRQVNYLCGFSKLQEVEA